MTKRDTIRVEALLGEYADARLACMEAIGHYVVGVGRDSSMLDVESVARRLRDAADRVAGSAHLLDAEGVKAAAPQFKAA